MFTPPIARLFNVTELDIGRAITDFTSRLSYDALEEDAMRVLNDLTPFETEVQSRDDRWFIIRHRPYRTVEGNVNGIVLTFVDITSRRDTQRQLRESQESYQTLFNSIDEGFTVFDVIFENERPVDYRFVLINAAFERQTGLSNPIGKTAREMIPEHEEHWYEIYGRIAQSGMPERFEAPAEALGRFYDVYAFSIGDPGEHRVAALFRDVSDRKEAEAHRDMLTAELSHRVKNTLAVVQALARSTGGPDVTVTQYRDRLMGRIQALARAHDQLLQTQWQSADLQKLIEATLSPYHGTGRRQRIIIEGPDVRLTPKQGLGLALILHELATNASKYGSLSTDNGILNLRWNLTPTAEGEQLHLIWQESGGPTVDEKAEGGFGTRLIEQACTYELDGSVELKLHPDGLITKISFPTDLRSRQHHGP